MLSFIRYLESRTKRVETALSLLFASFFAVIVIRWWIPGLFSSYWLDETGSLWVSKGPASQLIHRVIQFPQSGAYCALLWLTNAAFGSKPFTFHLLSLAVSGFTAFGLYRLARRFLPVYGALLTVALWAGAGANFTLATQARPYAFATAACVACAWQLERWLDHPSWSNTFLLGIAGILPSYFFFPDIVVLGSVVIYGLFRLSQIRTIAASRVFGVAGSWLVLGVVPVAHYIAVAGVWKMHAVFLPPGDRLSLIWTILPVSFVVSYVVASILRAALPSGERPENEDRRQAIVLSSAFATLIPCALFLATKMGDGLWLLRYISAATPFVALLVASMLTALRPMPVQLAAFLVLATFSVPDVFHVYTSPPLIPDRTGRAYGTAIAELSEQLRPPGTVLIGASEFIEGERWKFPVSDSDKEWLMAPVTTQIPGANPILLPVRLEQGDDAYRADVLATLQKLDRAVYFGAPVPDWLAGVFKADEWTKEVHSATVSWQLVTFTRRRPLSAQRSPH